MALTTDARNKLYSLVQAVKKLLMTDIEEQLQQFYGIRPDGTVLMVEQLSTNDTERLYRARLLRDRLTYLSSNISTIKDRERTTVQQLVREQAFTILNRFAALRMAEERTIIQETIRQGYNSEGFLVFDSVTGGAPSADLFIRYTWYLNAIFDELAVDLPAVFDRFSPYALLFPTESTLLKLFDLYNSEDITAFRTEGRPAINLWREDETIGWMYQFYNSDDERKQMREVSAPRNSREMAVRNQFFTPRYVVQFLTDNTLGRIWYDMTGGNTQLARRCKFLIQEKSVESEAKSIVTPKDPRTLRLLDPACGSMHFGLYAFDLFEVIYLEAWDNYPQLLGDLRDIWTRKEFIYQIPALILANNIHGVDIDPRALQMAGLSLWLRAQRSYDDLGLAPSDRPAITKGNLVLAEALPGNPQLLSEAVKTLSKPMRRLVLHIWEQMRLAGEMGMILRIEHEIKLEIEAIRRDWDKMAAANQGHLFDVELQAEAEQLGNLNEKEQRESFFDNAEREVLEHLQNLAETATNDDAYQKLLFADDTTRGFAFIELCRQRYDAVVMNPPFGATSVATKAYVDSTYPDGKGDLAAVFVERMHEMLIDNGLMGAISTRNIFFLGSYLNWRKRYIINHRYLKYMADLGMGVLDAMIETAAYVMGRRDNTTSVFLRATKATSDQKATLMLSSLSSNDNIFYQRADRFRLIPNMPLAYWVDNKTFENFAKGEPFFIENKRFVMAGLQTADNERFCVNIWEVLPSGVACNRDETITKHKSWVGLQIADYSLRFFFNSTCYVKWQNDGKELKNLYGPDGQLLSRPQDTYGIFFKAGLSWSLRTARFEPHIIPFGNIATKSRYLAFFKNYGPLEILTTCALWNSEYYDYILKLSMERAGHPTFNNGSVNQSLYPILPEYLQNFLAKQTIHNHRLIQAVFEHEETSLYFTRPTLSPGMTLYSSIGAVLEHFAQNKASHLASLASINDRVYSHFGITEEEQVHIREIINNGEARPEGTVFNVSERELAEGIFSWLVGVAFGRWDVTLAHYPERIPVREDIFAPLPPQSPASLIQEGPIEYPIPLRQDGLGVVENGNPADLMHCIRASLRYLYPNTTDAIEQELAALLGVEDLADYLNQPNRFFASHLAQYTQNKRIAPIYWPLSVPSGRYTVWVYYPQLNDQTLYRIVSDYIKPKQAALNDDIRRLDASGTPNDRDRRMLADFQSLRSELDQMEADLLRIADLPYRPNHDDGVLLTAAPLHGFFRNRNWQQATEAAWRELQAGDYDWAHLTLPIWPDRVREKCKTDLSMAIAHGLEEICLVKPKEKKGADTKAPTKNKKGRNNSENQMKIGQ